MYDVLCYGAISLDVSGLLKKHAQYGGQAEAIDYVLSPGGDAALVALTLSGLGWKAALAGGPVGADPLGDYLRGVLAGAGVDLYVESRGKTSIAAIAIDPSGSRSTLTYHENTPFELIPVPGEAIGRSRFLYADGCYGPNSAAAGRAARTAGVPSALNLDSPAMEYTGLFDTVIASEGVSRLIAADPATAAEGICSRGAKLAIVTLGARGCVACDGGLTAVPAYRVSAVDTTGAGAAFAAGLVHAQLSGCSLAESLRIASAAGAYKCLVRGSYRRFSMEELNIFLESAK
jgi:sugar/nucleoside kinase (ribokinase family)